MLLLRGAVATGLVAVGAGVLCYQTDALNNPWCSSLRVIRFGRSSYAVSIKARAIKIAINL